MRRQWPAPRSPVQLATTRQRADGLRRGRPAAAFAVRSAQGRRRVDDAAGARSIAGAILRAVGCTRAVAVGRAGAVQRLAVLELEVALVGLARALAHAIAMTLDAVLLEHAAGSLAVSHRIGPVA